GPQTSVDFSWTLQPRTGTATPIPVKCTVKATRTGDPAATKGDAELTIDEQDCPQASGPPLKVKGSLKVQRGQDGFDALQLELSTTHRWGGPGQPAFSFLGTVKAKREKR